MVEIRMKNPCLLRVMIAKKGFSLSGFAREIGISQPYLSQLLKEKHRPSPRVAFKIAKGLNTDLEEIFLIKNIDIAIKKKEKENV